MAADAIVPAMALSQSPPRGASEPTADLIRRAQARDRDAFASLYKSRVESVSRYASTILRHAPTAEDVVSETFIQAWIKLPSLRDTGRFDAWLFRIAHRKCLDELRKARPEPLSATYDRIDAAPDRTPDGFVERAADQQFMRRAMQQLSDEQREVVVLRFLYDLPHDEVARIMGKNAAVRALQYRALGRLRKYLRQPDSGAGASRRLARV